jgi:hypothetical protein
VVVLVVLEFNFLQHLEIHNQQHHWVLLDLEVLIILLVVEALDIFKIILEALVLVVLVVVVMDLHLLLVLVETQLLLLVVVVEEELEIQQDLIMEVQVAMVVPVSS